MQKPKTVHLGKFKIVRDSKIKRLFFNFSLLSPGQSSIFDSAKHSVDPLPNVAVGMATTQVAHEAASTASNAALSPFQVQFIKNLIDESLDEFRYKRGQNCVKLIQ